MKNFEIMCTFTQEHDTTESFIRQVITLVLHLDQHNWKLKNKDGYGMKEYTDGNDDFCIDLVFVLDNENLNLNNLEISHFLSLCGMLFGDSVRVYGGGSAHQKQKTKPINKKKEKLNEPNQP